MASWHFHRPCSRAGDADEVHYPRSLSHPCIAGISLGAVSATASPAVEGYSVRRAGNPREKTGSGGAPSIVAGSACLRRDLGSLRFSLRELDFSRGKLSSSLGEPPCGLAFPQGSLRLGENGTGLARSVCLWSLSHDGPLGEIYELFDGRGSRGGVVVLLSRYVSDQDPDSASNDRRVVCGSPACLLG